MAFDSGAIRRIGLEGDNAALRAELLGCQNRIKAVVGSNVQENHAGGQEFPEEPQLGNIPSPQLEVQCVRARFQEWHDAAPFDGDRIVRGQREMVGDREIGQLLQAETHLKVYFVEHPPGIPHSGKDTPAQYRERAGDRASST